ncbi:MAG TPA: GNAT family protein [Solirubrobacteraceae bacterium]|nr:GNAT family protein [Solirubrobacteraceae bacterium]
MFEIVGPTLTLRLPEEADVAALFALGSDPETTQWFSWGPYRGEDEPRAWIERAAAERAAGERLSLVIARDGEAVGVTELTEPSRRDQRAMVGTWLGAAHWGTGVNAESKALLLYLAFAVLGLRRVGAYANVDNARSQHALEKLGFVREGLLRRWHRHGDRYHDVLVYGLLREEWADDVAVEVRGEVPAAFAGFGE